MQLITVFFLLSLLGSLASHPLEVLPAESFICQKCQQISSLITGNIGHVEKIVNSILSSILEGICQRLPKSELIDSICEVLQNNFVNGVNTIIEGLQKQLSPEVVCKKVCQ